MNNINLIFFENYKKLEKLCNEIYSVNNGVTQYINEMDNISSYKYHSIPNWNSDLSALKRLRRLRNQIAHNEGAFSDNLCTINDVEWLSDFHARILKQTDPLALLNQKETSSNARPPVQRNTMQIDFDDTKSQKFTNKIIFITLSLIIMIIGFCLILGLLIATQLFH